MKRDFFEEEDTRSRERYDDLRDGLQKAIGDFAEKLDIGPKMLALLLIDLGITYNTIDYVLSTAKPSALGLKRELDRLLREIGDFIRSTKKDADNKMAGLEEFLQSLESTDGEDSQNISSAA
jgi:hypothetical protein